jgi:chromosome segregation ATPase
MPAPSSEGETSPEEPAGASAQPNLGLLDKAALQQLLEETRSSCRDATVRADKFHEVLARAEEKADLQDSLEIKRQTCRLHSERLQEQQLLLEDARKQLRVQRDLAMGREEAIAQARSGLGQTAGRVEAARKAKLASDHETVMRREQVEQLKGNLVKVEALKAEQIAAVEVQKARLDDLNQQQLEVCACVA